MAQAQPQGDGMTPQEFKEKMLSLRSGDEEMAHYQMDNMICVLLRELEYDDGVDVFEAQEKWYA